MMLKQENYEAADAEFDRAIEINANYAKAFYQKGLVHKNLDEGTVEAFLQWFDRAIVLGEAQNDGEVVRLSKDAAHAELLYRGAKLIQDGKYSAAIELLRASLEYNLESADSYYRLAEASNKLERYDDAIKNGNLAITYEQGGSTDKAKIYFEIGLAYQMKGEKAKACEAFSSATYGSFRAPSEHKMEFELKCESTDPSN
jgi:tetratricopeptide (TPR) repeat protein